jgi:uncharacterized membrane-anchored protein
VTNWHDAAVKLATLIRPRRTALPGLSGTARVDGTDRHPATRELGAREVARRLKPGDIAVLDHLDLDKVTAQLLVAARPAAVVNAAPSISGRYPNLGPEIIVEAGIPLLDRVGSEALLGLVDGERLRLDGDTLYRDETPVARGQLLTADGVAVAMERARDGLTFQLRAFAANASEHLVSERDLLLDGTGVPQVRTSFEGRPAVVVVGGSGWKEDLKGLRGYLREANPVLVGVDSGADALIELGHTPDLVIGDLTDVSDAALTCGAEVVLHVTRGGRAPAGERLADLGVESVAFVAEGSGQDLALLLADTAGATAIVLAGAHTTLREFVDHSRDDMPGTFLTRLRVGAKLIDARAVAAVYRRHLAVWPLVVFLMLAVAGLVAALVLTGTDAFDGTTVGDWAAKVDVIGKADGWWADLVSWVKGIG